MVDQLAEAVSRLVVNWGRIVKFVGLVRTTATSFNVLLEVGVSCGRIPRLLEFVLPLNIYSKRAGTPSPLMSSV